MTIGRFREGDFRQGNGMASEVNWKTSSAEQLGGAASHSRDRADQSVENLIRRLIARVEESERRYSEALDDLHARLDQLSQTTEALPTTGSLEETETLERLRESPFEPDRAAGAEGVRSGLQ